MNNFVKYLISCFIGIFVGAVCVLWYQAIQRQCDNINGEVASVVWRQNHFLLSQENLINELKAQNIEFPEIVLAQAIIETDSFKSYSCTSNNNLFGLRNEDGTYMAFKHWTYCVAYYKSNIQNWTECPNDYYQYLNTLGYSNDSLYIHSLKQVVNNK
jgi:hypothetical protein